ncbi:hypothetical protein B0H14DRAFT_3611647 [Mycena olivaceomarginata]|nr:hypothetical protein B0H14DRAFT_3611647 [Mycena olivaceomarginata]
MYTGAHPFLGLPRHFDDATTRSTSCRHTNENARLACDCSLACKALPSPKDENGAAAGGSARSDPGDAVYHHLTFTRPVGGDVEGLEVAGEDARPLPNGAQVNELEDERAQYVLIDDDLVPYAATHRTGRCLRSNLLHRGIYRGIPRWSLEGHGFHIRHCCTRARLRPPAPPHLIPCFLQSTLSAPPRQPRCARSSLPGPHHPERSVPRCGERARACGTPKCFVNLVGPSLTVVLNARGAGGKGQPVRRGCWPNAQVRAYACAGGEREKPWRARIFATQALRQGEEIVDGWQWDDANAMHRGCEVAGLETPIPPMPTRRHLIAQPASILHALGGAGTRGACASTSAAAPAPIIRGLSPFSSHVRTSAHPGKEKGTEREWRMTRGARKAGRTDWLYTRGSRRYVFPGRWDAKEMELDIDIEPEDAPRAQGSPSSVLSASLAPPRLAASSSTPPHLERRHLRCPSPPPALLCPASLHLRIDNDEPVSRHRIDADHEAQPSRGQDYHAVPRRRSPPRAGARVLALVRGVRAVERVRGSGGCGGVVLDRGELDSPLYAAQGYAGHKKSAEGYMGDGTGYSSTSTDAYAGTGGDAYAAGASGSMNKPYAVVERSGGWGHTRGLGARLEKTTRADRVYGKTWWRDRDRARRQQVGAGTGGDLLVAIQVCDYAVQ